jgi:MerR family copper efflux transcriptional regulator
VTDRLIGACCSLSAEELRPRLASWRALRDRATSIEEMSGGARLQLAAREPIDAVAGLVAAEAECCPFYTFVLRVDGAARQLEISAGIGGEPAVRALIGLED